MTKNEIQQELDKVVEFLNPYVSKPIKTKIDFQCALQHYLENAYLYPVMDANDVDDERHRLKYELFNLGFTYPDIGDMLDMYSTYIEYQLEILKPLSDLAFNKQYYSFKENLTI